MDELLRAYAKKRREQAEPAAEMHPATRKLLHDEVKRTFAAKPASQSWRVWRWPLLAMWGGMAVLLVMFAMLNAQFRSMETGERKEEGRRMKDEKRDALTRNSSPAGAGEKMESFKQKTPVPQEIASAVVPPAAPAAVVEGFDNASAPLGVSAAAVASDSVRGAASYRRSPASASTPLSASVEAQVAAGNFVQVHDRVRSGAALFPPSNLLSNFRMLRSGQNVSVVDADGSVYNGQVLNGTSNRSGFGGAAQQKAKAPKDGMEETNWTFNVTGTNHSLRQNIIFTGDVLDMPWANTFNNAAAQNRNSFQFQNGSNGSQIPSTQNSRITGKVQVGGGKPYEIEAKPPAP